LGGERAGGFGSGFGCVCVCGVDIVFVFVLVLVVVVLSGVEIDDSDAIVAVVELHPDFEGGTTSPERPSRSFTDSIILSNNGILCYLLFER